MSEVDRLVEMITQRVQERLNGARPTAKLALVPRDRGECNDDSAAGEDCASCGVCVVRRPWSVRAMEGAGALRVGAPLGVGAVPTDLAKLIDHTLLKPEATRDEVVKLCEEARKHRFASVCVNTTWVPLCKALLAGTDVMVCAVVGFPLGAMTPSAKAYEAREAMRQGAKEIDMVINIGALKSRDYETVFEDICKVVKAAAPAAVKVILETSALDTEQKIIGSTLSKLAGAAFVKTSTGFGKGGATVEDVELMRRVVGPELGVKASGGVRTAEDVLKMAQAGANRIGASASVAIVSGTADGKAKAGGIRKVLPVQLIRKKRDGGTLDDAEIRTWIAGVTDGSLPDYQVAAMLMAIFFRGLTDGELAAWADAMTRSGDVIDLSRIARGKVDKHSTGGVGDKISIPLAPAVAACGVAVPMVSGRGLGHTGGTLDKLESIPGFRIDLPVERFAELVDELGVCLIGQTARIAPADKRLYALRDVTATVESLPLIASSIMSKKLAEGIDGLVIDCKVGRGAFMKTVERARELCALMQAIGRRAGKRITCVLTDMNAPIGRTIGNALEIRESIEILRGGGPRDTRELTHVLGGEMLVLGGVAKDAADGRAQIEQALGDGRALEVFRKVVAAQGGDPRVCDSPGSVLPKAKSRDELALRPGRIVAIDSEALGIAALILGAGRRAADDKIDPAAGLVVDAYLGEHVEPGAPPQVILCHNLAANDRRLGEARAMIEGAFVIQPADQLYEAPPASRILEVLA